MRLVSGIAAIVASCTFVAAPAHAAIGDELVGNTVDIRFSDGSVNSVMFDQGGRATIQGDGVTDYASWLVSDNQLCLQTTAARECWSYTQSFVAGQPMSLASSCDGVSEWTARSVNAPVQAAPVSRMGERG